MVDKAKARFKKVRCDRCPMKFSNEVLLKEHQRTSTCGRKMPPKQRAKPTSPRKKQGGGKRGFRDGKKGVSPKKPPKLPEYASLTEVDVGVDNKSVGEEDDHSSGGIESEVDAVGEGEEVEICNQLMLELNQLLYIQKEMQKQLAVIAAAQVTKEGKRLEVALGQSMEKNLRSSYDGIWARLEVENIKQDKAMLELTKDLAEIIDKSVKGELTAVGQSLTEALAPTIEKTVSTSLKAMNQLEKSVNSKLQSTSLKAMNQLEESVNSKLQATVARQIQTQFQTSAKQALQETLKSCLEGSVIPAFEISCRSMFEQVDATFQKGMIEHAAAIHQQFDTSHSPLAIALRDFINSASSITLDSQRKLLALAFAGENPKASNALLEDPLDPSRLIAEQKYEEAFTVALERGDVAMVSWLCSQVDLPAILYTNPLPLSQAVLLSLLQQLACDISNETLQKLTWLRDILSVIDPADPVIAVRVYPIFEEVYQFLNDQRKLPTTTSAELSTIRLILHILNSMGKLGLNNVAIF